MENSSDHLADSVDAKKASKPVIDSIKRQNFLAYNALAGCMVFLVTIAMWYALGTAVSALGRVSPRSLSIDVAKNFGTDDAAILKNAPFLEAVKSQLQSKSIDGNEASPIILVWSTAIEWPTVTSRISLTLPHGNIGIEGYGFRVSSLATGAQCFVPLHAEYTSPEKISFNLEQCERGDKIFFIGRCTERLTKSQLSQIRFQIVDEDTK